MERRIGGYVLNILILIIPIFFIYNKCHFSTYLHAYGFIDNSGLDIFSAIIEVLCPIYILGIYISGGGIILPSIGLSLLIMIDTIFVFLFQGDLGKRVYGFKIVNLNGTRISLIRSFIRTTVKYITIAFIPIVFIYPFINSHSNTVHDKIAKTKVIKRVV